MNPVKERIIGAVSIMNDADAKIVWDMITDIFPSRSWEDVEEVEPDEIDLEMLREIAGDPDYDPIPLNEDSRCMGRVIGKL